MGAIFVCLLTGISVGETYKDPLSQIKKFDSDFKSHKQDFAQGELALSKDTIYFPWASQQPAIKDASSIMPRCKPTKEAIKMDSSNPEAQISDLKAVNTVKQRDIAYDDYQMKDQNSKSLVNSLEAHVSKGPGEKELHSNDLGSDGLERYVDGAVAAGMNNADGRVDGVPHDKPAFNYMDIDVSGVTVSAINTVAGGSAVATSNIIIKPVQVINYPSEMEEKLK